MTNDELSARVADARGESHTRRGELFYHNGRFLPDGSLALRRAPKPYATDMNVAWGLVEEMNDSGLEIMIHTKFKCCFDKFKSASVYEADDTMPRAICRAYLAFKGVE